MYIFFFFFKNLLVSPNDKYIAQNNKRCIHTRGVIFVGNRVFGADASEKRPIKRKKKKFNKRRGR